MSVANIGKLQENFVAMQESCEISQQKGHHFAAQGWFRSRAKFAFSLEWSASNGCNSFISTLNHTLFEHWIADFPTFKTTYSMNKLSSRKSSKSGWQWLSSRMLHVRFLFASPPCIHDLLMAKDFKASKLWFFMFLSFPLLCHGFQRTLLNLGLLWWSNY